MKNQDELLSEYRYLVTKIAKKYRDHHKRVYLEDLESDGMIGLLQATKKFDPSFNIEFSIYAEYWIREYMNQGLRQTYNLIHIPVWVSKRIKANKSSKILKCINAAKLIKSALIFEFIPKDSSYFESTFSMDTQYLNHLLQILSPRERIILEQRYGLNNQFPKSLEQIGIGFGVSRQAIFHLEKRAIKKLREYWTNESY